jgi:hypothetical protein
VLQVASLHRLGLPNCCAASYGDRLVIFELNKSTPAEATITKALRTWQAHSPLAPGHPNTISCLHVSPIMAGLFSGAADGSIRM